MRKKEEEKEEKKSKMFRKGVTELKKRVEIKKSKR